MSAEPKCTTAPAPVFARRHVKPQYLAPGQHLKVASRRPPVSQAHPARVLPRDPWESQDRDDEDQRNDASVRSPKADPPPSAAASTPTRDFDAGGGGGGGQSPRVAPHATSTATSSCGGGHPFSSHLSRSRSSVNSEALPMDDAAGQRAAPSDAAGHVQRQPSASFLSQAALEGNNQEGGETAERVKDDNEDNEDEDSYYHTADGGPELSASQRAQRVLEMQQCALEGKQLKALTDQGVARRPKTLVRNRHGRLQAITAQPSAASVDAPLPIADAPLTMKARPPRRGTRAPTAKPKAEAAVAAVSRGGGDANLVNSRPSTPTERDAARLDIDLD